MSSFFLLKSSYALELDKWGTFSGRVSRINTLETLIRFRLNFENRKFIKKNDDILFWIDSAYNNRCSGSVVGKSNDYILVKIKYKDPCLNRLNITTGSYTRFFSQNLIENIKKAQEVTAILLKKRLAIEGRKNRYLKELDGYVLKVNLINERYALLKQKLEHEWDEELGRLERERVEDLKSFKNAEIYLGEIDLKVEKYKIYDHNLKVDRWALDQRYYLRK